MATIKDESEKSRKHWEAYYAVLQKQDWKKALAALNEIKKLEPDNVQVRLKLGDLLHRSGDLKGARVAYHQAAASQLGNGNSQKALAIYKIILRFAPDDEEALNKSKGIMTCLERPQATTLKPEGKTPPGADATGMSYIAINAQQPPAQPKKSAAPAKEAAPIAEAPEDKNKPAMPFDLGLPKEEPAGEEEPGFGDLSLGATMGATMQTQSDAEPVKDIGGLYSAALEGVPETAPAADSGRRVPEIFSVVTPEDVDLIFERGAMLSFKPGEAVIQEGGKGNSFYIIQRGAAEVSSNIMGRRIKLAVLREADFFGEVSFLTGRPRTATVIAMEDFQVLEIKHDLLHEVIERNPLLLDSLADFYHSRVQDTIRKVKG